MAKQANAANLPAKNGNGNNGFAVATQDDIEAYSFVDTTALDAIRENIGNADLSPSDFERIKFPSAGSQFWEIVSLNGESEPVKSIEGIVLMHKNTRVYWANEYTGEKVPPDCSSDNGVFGKGNPGGACATCPYSQWNSDPKGGGGQACKAIGIQFVMRPDEVLPVIVPVPPTSLAGMKKFMLKLVSKKLKYYECILSFGLEQAQNKGGIKYSRINPKVVSVLPPEARKQIEKYQTAFAAAFNKVTATQEDAAGAVDTEE